MVIALISFFIFKSQLGNSIVNNEISSDNNSEQEEIEYVFVPYWTFTNEINSGKEELIYFGISVNEKGIDENDPGFEKLADFSDLTKGKKKYLALRIIGQEAAKIVDNVNSQKKVAQDIAKLAKDNGFKGVVVDFETSAFGFSSTEGKITSLYKNLHEEIKKENLEFAATVFGDNYYRARPYNIKAISELSDLVIVMAYDFHKARLNPGPNFPFSGKEKYGYDFKEMVEDFRKDVKFEKIVVALGYFGYDWKLGNGTSAGMADPLSLHQINSRYIENCEFEECKLDINDDLESKVSYKDSEGFSHEVWFENIESAEKKINYLSNQGINQIAFWAYSYY